MTETRYRALLLVYAALLAVEVAAAYFAEYSEALTYAYENEPEPWLMRNLWVAGALFGSLVVGLLAGFIGLFFFKRWARPLSLYLTIAGILTYPFLGVSLSSGLEDSLFEASATVWGAILAVSYCSAVSARFER